MRKHGKGRVRDKHMPSFAYRFVPLGTGARLGFRGND